MARRTRQSPIPPPLEMACLGVLWTIREGTVHDVIAGMTSPRTLAYTTVMTLLERLVKRGHLKRRKAGRSFVYTPAQDPAELRELALDEFVQNYFSGSREALRDWLSGRPVSHPIPETTTSDSIDTALL